LIDGDMRKPDVGMLLKFDGKSRGVCKVLLGCCSFQEAVWSVPSTGLDVLVGDSDDSLNCFEVLAQPQAARCFAAICAKYDNVIIDTPPILAVPDGLLWAKMADVAVVASLAGQTAEPELQKALERLKQINVRVSGVVVNSVSVKSSYSYGYGYGYGKGYGRPKDKNGGDKRRSILLSAEEPGKNNTNV
jgi:polysaccharide biosynthesis transport protein